MKQKNWNNNMNLSTGSLAMSALRGDGDMPEILYESKTCSKGHGMNGRTARYRNNGACVFCQANSQRNRIEEPSRMVEIDRIMERKSEGASEDLW